MKSEAIGKQDELQILNLYAFKDRYNEHILYGGAAGGGMSRAKKAGEAQIKRILDAVHGDKTISNNP